MSEITIRAANKSDAALIAELFLISSDGLADYIWSQVAEPGESALDAGTRRYARPGVAFSYENCLLAEVNGRPVGMAHSFPMDVDPDEAPTEDPILRPYYELEDDGSLYLSGLAVVDDVRGRGIGTTLLRAVEAKAKETARARVSLICFEMNAGAMRLYDRFGYREIDRRALVPHPCLHYQSGDALLLVKDVA
ncbi:MAG: GNAT family N-acetyltransferase [Pseudomonadota bacterium]